jgi:hypothetical protein
MRAMTGETSGLPSDVQKDLKRWDDMFHLEMHGGTHSLVQELGELQKGKILQIGPSVIQDAFIMYVNRSSELGWMVTRLLPYLQMTEHAFGDDWHKKRDILDDSFRYMLEGFTNLGKRLGASFITMVDDKFAFKQPFYYSEADGSQMPGAQVASQGLRSTGFQVEQFPKGRMHAPFSGFPLLPRPGGAVNELCCAVLRELLQFAQAPDFIRGWV